ncbi:MAG TPA: serine hydrolase domain-containing protein, partial [Chitinophagales bacterium]|nr:serine hydrolase domain-containing protein [Chitinophagales bacterium]
MKKIYSLIFALCVATLTFAQQPAFITDSLDSYIQREMKKWNIPGMAVAIVKDGQIVVEKGYGVTDVHTGQKTDQNSLFMVASNSKAFTGTALSLLEYQKRLNLNDKVTTYLPYFKLYDPNASQLVTVEDLMCHRLGLETFQGDFLNWDGNLSREQVVRAMALHKPSFEFRDTYGYCNAGFVAAAEVLYAVTDTTIDDFLKAHIFTPLQMTRTSTTHAAIAADKNACKPYTVFDGRLVQLEYDNVDNLAAAASINSSAHDLANWLIMQLNNGKFNDVQVLPKQVVNNPRLPRTVVGSGNSSIYKSQHFNLYGLGWFIKDFEGRRVYSHDGGANGFVTGTTFIPEAGLGIVVLTNTDANAFYDALRYQIMEAYFNVPYRNISDIYLARVTPGNEAQDSVLHRYQAIAEKNLTPALPIASYTGKYHNEVYGD